MKSPPVAIRGLQHAGIPVTELERSCRFYQELGFAVVMEARFPHELGTGRVAMLRLGAVTLELYEFPAGALEAVRGRGDGHLDHLAFDVADIEAAYAGMAGAGHRMCEPAPVRLEFWERGCRYFNVLGPDGERLEFNQIL